MHFQCIFLFMIFLEPFAPVLWLLYRWNYKVWQDYRLTYGEAGTLYWWTWGKWSSIGLSTDWEVCEFCQMFEWTREVCPNYWQTCYSELLSTNWSKCTRGVISWVGNKMLNLACPHAMGTLRRGARLCCHHHLVLSVVLLKTFHILAV